MKFRTGKIFILFAGLCLFLVPARAAAPPPDAPAVDMAGVDKIIIWTHSLIDPDFLRRGIGTHGFRHIDYESFNDRAADQLRDALGPQTTRKIGVQIMQDTPIYRTRRVKDQNALIFDISLGYHLNPDNPKAMFGSIDSFMARSTGPDEQTLGKMPHVMLESEQYPITDDREETNRAFARAMKKSIDQAAAFVKHKTPKAK